jgi:hypothetical protein
LRIPYGTTKSIASKGVPSTFKDDILHGFHFLEAVAGAICTIFELDTCFIAIGLGLNLPFPNLCSSGLVLLIQSPMTWLYLKRLYVRHDQNLSDFERKPKSIESESV